MLENVEKHMDDNKSNDFSNFFEQFIRKKKN